MKYLLLVGFLAVSFTCFGQIESTNAISDFTTMDTSPPCSFCSPWRYDKASQVLNRWNGSAWVPDGVSNVVFRNDSLFVVNNGSEVFVSIISGGGGTDDQTSAEVSYDNTGTNLVGTNQQTATTELAINQSILDQRTLNHYVISDTAPTDTTLIWVEKTDSRIRVWDVKRYATGSWGKVALYNDYAQGLTDGKLKVCQCDGQSNGIGFDTTTTFMDRTPVPNFLVLNTESWTVEQLDINGDNPSVNSSSPETNFRGDPIKTGGTPPCYWAMRYYLEDNPNDIVILVPTAEGGQIGERWLINDPSSRWGDVTEILDSLGASMIDYHVWSHGESNRDDSTYAELVQEIQDQYIDLRPEYTQSTMMLTHYVLERDPVDTIVNKQFDILATAPRPNLLVAGQSIDTLNLTFDATGHWTDEACSIVGRHLYDLILGGFKYPWFSSGSSSAPSLATSYWSLDASNNILNNNSAAVFVGAEPQNITNVVMSIGTLLNNSNLQFGIVTAGGAAGDIFMRFMLGNNQEGFLSYDFSEAKFVINPPDGGLRITKKVELDISAGNTSGSNLIVQCRDEPLAFRDLGVFSGRTDFVAVYDSDNLYQMKAYQEGSGNPNNVLLPVRSGIMYLDTLAGVNELWVNRANTIDSWVRLGSPPAEGLTDGRVMAATSSGLLQDFPLEIDGSTVNFTQSTAVKLPSGTSAQRPISVDIGDIRVNTDNDEFEGSVDGVSYISLIDQNNLNEKLTTASYSLNTDVVLAPTTVSTNYTLETNSSATQNTNMTLPTASQSYAGWSVTVWSLDGSGSFDNTISASTIQNGVISSGSITLSPFQATTITCMRIATSSSYRWIVTNQY